MSMAREDNKAEELGSLSEVRQESNSNFRGNESISFKRNDMWNSFLEACKRYEKSPLYPLKAFIESCLSSFKCTYGCFEVINEEGDKYCSFAEAVVIDEGNIVTDKITKIPTLNTMINGTNITTVEIVNKSKRNHKYRCNNVSDVKDLPCDLVSLQKFGFKSFLSIPIRSYSSNGIERVWSVLNLADKNINFFSKKAHAVITQNLAILVEFLKRLVPINLLQKISSTLHCMELNNSLSECIENMCKFYYQNFDGLNSVNFALISREHRIANLASLHENQSNFGKLEFTFFKEFFELGKNTALAEIYNKPKTLLKNKFNQDEKDIEIVLHDKKDIKSILLMPFQEVLSKMKTLELNNHYGNKDGLLNSNASYSINGISTLNLNPSSDIICNNMNNQLKGLFYFPSYNSKTLEHGKRLMELCSTLFANVFYKKMENTLAFKEEIRRIVMERNNALPLNPSQIIIRLNSTKEQREPRKVLDKKSTVLGLDLGARIMQPHSEKISELGAISNELPTTTTTTTLGYGYVPYARYGSQCSLAKSISTSTNASSASNHVSHIQSIAKQNFQAPKDIKRYNLNINHNHNISISSIITKNYHSHHRYSVKNRLSDLKIVSMLGEGTFGIVFKALYKNSTVAAKIVMSDKTSDRMPLEFELQASVTHTNIVKCFPASFTCMTYSDLKEMSISVNNISKDTMAMINDKNILHNWLENKRNSINISDKSFHIITMEYCDLGTLSDAILQKNIFKFHEESGSSHNIYNTSSLTINMKSILDTAHEIANAMSQLISQGIIHGDLKPANILLHTSKDSDRGWISKVADFGTSRILGYKEQDIKFGTLLYMPPEIIGDGKYNNHDYNDAIDVYSFGIILWEMYSGKKPYANLKCSSEIISHVRHQGMRPEFDKKCPQIYSDLAKRCWDKNYKVRPSFEKIIEEIKKIKDSIIMG